MFEQGLWRTFHHMCACTMTTDDSDCAFLTERIIENDVFQAFRTYLYDLG